MVMEDFDFRFGNTQIKKFDISKNKIHIKMENENPTGSVKDRSVWYMVKEKVKKQGSHFVIASSGNAGISLAFLCKIYKCECTIFVSSQISSSKINILKQLGADIVMCDGEESTKDGGWIFESWKYFSTLRKTEKYYIDQFNNNLNALAHFESTAPEIFEYFSGNNVELDYIFLGIGSGGTAVGIQEYIDFKKLRTKIIICDPYGGIIYDSFYGNPIQYIDHNIESISDSFIPNNIQSLKKFHDVIQGKNSNIANLQTKLFKDTGIFGGEVTSFIYSLVLDYIEDKGIEQKNILLLNTESGIR